MSALQMPAASRRRANRQRGTKPRPEVVTGLIEPLRRGGEEYAAGTPAQEAFEPFAFSDEVRDDLALNAMLKAEGAAPLFELMPLPERIALEASAPEIFDTVMQAERAKGEESHATQRSLAIKMSDLRKLQYRMERFTRPLYLAAVRAAARRDTEYGPAVRAVARVKRQREGIAYEEDISIEGRLSALHRNFPDLATRAILAEAGVSLEGTEVTQRLEFESGPGVRDLEREPAVPPSGAGRLRLSPTLRWA